SVRKPKRLSMSSPIANGSLPSGAHFGDPGYCHPWDCPYADRHVHRSQVLQSILLDIAADFRFNAGERPEAELELFGHPDSREVFVPRPISEPSAHQKKRVVLICSS